MRQITLGRIQLLRRFKQIETSSTIKLSDFVARAYKCPELDRGDIIKLITKNQDEFEWDDLTRILVQNHSKRFDCHGGIIIELAKSD